jgi:hypothetical protein
MGERGGRMAEEGRIVGSRKNGGRRQELMQVVNRGGRMAEDGRLEGSRKNGGRRQELMQIGERGEEE